MTFWQYLRTQTDQASLVGDLARDAVMDDVFPRGRGKGFTSLSMLIDYLESHDACDGALMAATTAWASYLRLDGVDPGE